MIPTAEIGVPDPVRPSESRRITLTGITPPQASMQGTPQVQSWGGDFVTSMGAAVAHAARAAVTELARPDPGGGPSRSGVKVALYLGVVGTILGLVAIVLVLSHQVLGNRVLEVEQEQIRGQVSALELQGTESRAALSERMTAIERAQSENANAIADIARALSGQGQMLEWLVRVEVARARGEKVPAAPLPFDVSP